jgi:hypothetical protein
MTEMVIETSVQYVQLTRLIARENYIKFTRRESTKTYTGKEMFPPIQNIVGISEEITIHILGN